MKKLWWLLVLTLLLTGCGASEVWETVTDVDDTPVMAQMQQIKLTLPKDAASETMENTQAGKIYLCNGYTVTAQTLPGGDLDKTLREISGFSRQQLTVMETQSKKEKRYECVWAAAGEAEDQVARAVILDDGHFHYAVTVMAPFSTAGDLAAAWQSVLTSVQLEAQTETASQPSTD